MRLALESYLTQLSVWPKTGQHVLAQFDETSVVVYQAYNARIGHYAAAHGRFGGDFSFSRMTWLKTNFLWMMYRSGWGTKPDQEITLAIVLDRGGFETILESAVASSFQASGLPTREEWEEAVARSDVRLQWDPDHGPSGAPQKRRAIQIGIRGDVVHRFNDEWLIAIEDVSSFVAEQRGRDPSVLVTPRERVLPLPAPLAGRLRIDD